MPTPMKSSTDLLLGYLHNQLDMRPNAVFPLKAEQGRWLLAWAEAHAKRIAEARTRGQMVCGRCYNLTPIDTSGECRACRRGEQAYG